MKIFEHNYYKNIMPHYHLIIVQNNKVVRARECSVILCISELFAMYALCVKA